MNEGSVISQLKINFYRRIDKPDEVRFLDSSTLNHAICLEIAEATFNDLLISYEDLCHKIPRKIGARSTILNSLNYAVSKKFFIKKSYEKDRRIKTYALSEAFKITVKEWINELREVTSNFK
jgi:hypothetical protein